MKNLKLLIVAAFLILFLSMTSGCALFNGSQKSGCPSNGKNIGAERVLSGEKLPKAKKFKS